MTTLDSAPSAKPIDKRAIQALLWALKPLSNLRGSIPLPYVTIFLMVALDEGKSVSTYARAVGVKDRRIMSRYLRDIGDRARNGGPGLGLVTIEPNPTKPRAHQVHLTAKGRAVADAIARQMRPNAKAFELAAVEETPATSLPRVRARIRRRIRIRKSPKLILAAQRVAEARKIVADQEQLIERLRTLGKPTLKAEQYLQVCMSALKDVEDYERGLREAREAKIREARNK